MGMLRFEVILSKPWFTEVIFVFRNRDAANILIDYPIFTESRL